MFEARHWQVDYLFDLGFQGWLVHIGVIGLTSTLLINALPDSTWPFWWSGIMVLLSLTLASLCRYQSRRKSKFGHATLRAGWFHTGLTTIVGLTWGSGAISASEASFQVLTLYSLALGGTALGAVSSQHAVPRSCFVSIWTSTSLLALAHVLHNPRLEGVLVALMMLLYAMILSILCVRMFRFLVTNQRLTQSLEEKVAELTVVAGELDQARHAAEDANRAKSSFLAQASHDLRQPVHAIGLFTASMKETSLEEDQRDMVNSIEKSVESLTHLFGSLLDIFRLEVGGVTPRAAPADLGDLVARLVDQNRDAARRRGCRLRAVGSAAWVHTDAGLLATMVQNILSNAFKYAPGSQVLIGPRRSGGRLGLQICDTGPGIDPSQAEAVFEEYYRLDASSAPEVEGMGLGLAIVRRLGDLLDLDVRLSSIPGKGTSVTIFGLDQVDPAEAERVSPARAHPLSGRRICLIDSDPVIRAATVRLLERWGCLVEVHDAPPSQAQACDIILTDIPAQGEIGGSELIHVLRDRAGWDIPVAVLTGHSVAEAGPVAARLDAPVLHKPVSPAKLRATLTSLCLNAQGPHGRV
ncbi:response regulator [Rhodobacteraceae bacterium 63075]|nr:response regulator [Rhodobacteraceae bacterium 63075]